MAGHVPKRHLKLPEVDKLLLEGCVLWKWDDGESSPQKLTFKADKDGFFLSARGEDSNKVYDSCVWDLQLVSDVRGGKVPKDSKLLENLLSLTGSESLEGFSLTLVYHRDGIVNLDLVNLICEWPDTAEHFKCAVNALTYNMLHAHASPVVFYRKNYTKILLHADGQGRIPLKYINRIMMSTKQSTASYINQFLAGFNIVVVPDEKGAEKYVRAESFTWDLFMRMVDQLLNNRTGDLDLVIPSVSSKKVSLIQKVKIELSDFQKFLNTKQRDPRLNEILHPPVSKAQARELMGKHEDGKDRMTARGLLDYLMSEENNVLDVSYLDQYMDMNKPLNHYFVNSSHNTYLNGHQLRSQSLSEMYIQTLLKGCRCVELDCWPTGGGEAEDICITHGGTLCTKVTFKECVEAINEFAFVTSEYPVILSIENHCKSRPHLIQKMANIFTNTFGDKLLKESFDDMPLEPGVPLPSLERLKGKILLKDKVKRKKFAYEVGTLPRNAHGQGMTAAMETNDTAGDDAGSGSCGKEPNGREGSVASGDKPGDGGGGEGEGEDRGDDSSKESSVPPEAQLKEKRKASEELSAMPNSTASPANTLKRGEQMAGMDDMPVRWHETEAMVSGPLKELLNYTTGITFEGFAAAEKLNCNFYMSSFVEDKGQNFIKTQARDFLKYTQRQNSRIYPNGSRINSSNYMPQIFWNVGCQFVALNYQTSDLPVQLNQAKFEFNGGTGFIQKPWVMMREGGGAGVFNPFTQSKLEDIVPARLSIKVISGSFLTEKRTNCLVEAEMYGLPADTVRHKYTKKAAAPHPFWNEEPFTFKRILLPELAILRVAVFDDDRELVGQRCLPVNHIRPGFRYIPLRDKHNQPLPLSMLFVNIKVEDWVPNEFEDVVAMLMDPISFATKALEELAKGDDFEDMGPGEEGTSEVDSSSAAVTSTVPKTPATPLSATLPDSALSPLGLPSANIPGRPISVGSGRPRVAGSGLTTDASACHTIGRVSQLPQTAAMSDFPDTLPSFEKAKERSEPASVKCDSKEVTEQKGFVKTTRKQSKQRLDLVKGHEKSYKTLQSRLQKSKSFDLQSPKELESLKMKQGGEIFTFDHDALRERHAIHKNCLEMTQAAQMNDLEKQHKSDLDTMHKELAALIKRQTKSGQAADKKRSKSDLEEKAIKLGKILRGEFAKLHATEKAKLIENHETERKRLLESQAAEHNKLESIAETEESSPASHL